MGRMWAKLILVWHGCCPKHGLERVSWNDNNHTVNGYGRRYFGKKCNTCMDIKRFKKEAKSKKSEYLLERAREAIKPKEEQWQTLNKK